MLSINQNHSARNLSFKKLIINQKSINELPSSDKKIVDKCLDDATKCHLIKLSDGYNLNIAAVKTQNSFNNELEITASRGDYKATRYVPIYGLDKPCTSGEIKSVSTDAMLEANLKRHGLWFVQKE